MTSASTPANHRTALLVVLGGCAAILPLSTDIVLPVLPVLGEMLGAPQAQVQQVLTAFVLGFGMAHAFVGALLDRFGARRVLLTALALLALTAFTTSLAQSLAQIVALRFLQGALAAVAPITMRMLVREMAPPQEAPNLLSKMGVALGLMAIAAPFIGAALTRDFGWRFVFAGIAGYAILLALGATATLPTRSAAGDRGALSFGALLGVARRALRSAPFRGATAGAALGYTGLMSHLVGSPFIAHHQFPTVRSGPALVIGLGGAGYLIGSLTGAQLNKRWLPHHVALLGAGSMCLAAVTLAALASTPWFVWPMLAACVALFGVGWSLVQPWAQATALVGNESEAGRVSALYGLLQLCGVSLLVSVIGRWLTTAYALSAVWCVVGIAILFVVRATRAAALRSHLSVQ